MIVRPTGSGQPAVFANGRVDAAVGTAGFGAGLQDNGYAANVGGHAGHLSTACRSLPVMPPGVVGTVLDMIQLWRLVETKLMETQPDTVTSQPDTVTSRRASLPS